MSQPPPRPLGIPHSHPDRDVSPAEELALELERVVKKLRQLLARVCATPTLRGGRAPASLGEIVSQTVTLAQEVAPHIATNLHEEREARFPRVVGAAGDTASEGE